MFSSFYFPEYEVLNLTTLCFFINSQVTSLKCETWDLFVICIKIVYKMSTIKLCLCALHTDIALNGINLDVQAA